MSLSPLAALRLRLTAWCAVSFELIISLLGAGLFVVIRHQFARQLDGSLRQATVEFARAAGIRERGRRSARRVVVDAVDELHGPDRQLYLLDTLGRPVKPPVADAWIREAARDAALHGLVDRWVHARAVARSASTPSASGFRAAGRWWRWWWPTRWSWRTSTLR